MKDDLKVVVSILGVVVIFLFLYYAGDEVGIDSKVMDDIMAVLPGLSAIIVGCLMLGVIRHVGFIIPGFAAIGVGFAILLGEMNDVGMVVDTWVTEGYALIGLQGFSIVASIVLGAVVMMRRR